MVLRLIMRYLANNERLIQTLSDSYPMRRAARFVAGLIIRSKNYQEKAIENLKKQNGSNVGANQSQDFSTFLSDQMQRLRSIFKNERK